MKIELESGQKQGTRASHTPNACFSSVARKPGTGPPIVPVPATVRLLGRAVRLQKGACETGVN
ncbi:Histone-lysine N-methyltransferase SETDB1, partial [Clarias magur]